ncbi:MAG: hypothetical protein ACE5EV_00810 [Gaiellales bacterium]
MRADHQASDLDRATVVPGRAAPPTDADASWPWVELASACVLAVATLCTAWSAYQATRWSGIQAIKFSEAAATRVESSRASTFAGQLAQLDAASFGAWVEAVLAGDDELARAQYARFRDDLRTAVDAWLEANPRASLDALSSPFALANYSLPELVEADRLTVEAESRAREGRQANQRSDNYVLAVVLFAAALFFAGIAPRFRAEAPQTVMLICGALVLGGTVGWIATFPVSIAV